MQQVQDLVSGRRDVDDLELGGLAARVLLWRRRSSLRLRPFGHLQGRTATSEASCYWCCKCQRLHHCDAATHLLRLRVI